MDADLRALERRAGAGDREAQARLLVELARAGDPVCKTPHRLMTPGEVEMAHHLARCRFSPGTAAKRIARGFGDQAAAIAPWITSKQAPLLRRLVTKYRRQIPELVLRLTGLPYDHGCATCLRFDGHSLRCPAHPERPRERAAMPLFDEASP